MERKYGVTTAKQRSAVRTYTGGSFRMINHAVRDGDVASHRTEVVDATAAMRPSTIALKLWRDTGFTDFFDPTIMSTATVRAHIGEVFAWRRFASSRFTKKRTYSVTDQVRFHIEAPVGTPMIYASMYGSNPGEYEWLLSPHTMFRIVKVEEENGKTQVYVRIVGVVDTGAGRP
jgi:hypothetical protein